MSSPAEELELYQSAHFYPRNTGLPMTVWVRFKGHAGGEPCIKVCTTHGERAVLDDTVSVTIRQSTLLDGALAAEDLKAVQSWIDINRHALLGYWEGDLGTGELVAALRSV